MIQTNNPKIKEIITEFHEAMLRKSKRKTSQNKDILIESRVFSILCNNYDMQPTDCAIQMNSKYNYNFTNSDIIQIFRKRRMANPIERKELFEWANEITSYFEKAMVGDKESFYKFEKRRKQPALKNGKRHDSQERIAAIMIFEKFPEMDTYNDIPNLHLLSNTLAKYFFYDMADAISNVYGFIPLRNYKKEDSKTLQNKKMSYEEMTRKIIQLENMLERTTTMLQDLQDEFEEQLEESKTKELTSFFIKLNSEKYGCILDELLMVRKGIDTLRKNNYELPIEINGLLIMVKKLIQFVMDSHIEPLMKINSIKEVIASDIEFCNYEGTPFSSEHEVKKVKVISSGWIYKDKEIQISCPKVKEEQ